MVRSSYIFGQCMKAVIVEWVVSLERQSLYINIDLDDELALMYLCFK